ncbi:DUF3618 domain-containing protein [Streptomyces sp. NPDC051366]|uniref:DUF3618 domain-containing protein n=1 Tax=Streptomyces sp. NPDC051366 TaxID=3365652 RepID=UPI0037B7D05F
MTTESHGTKSVPTAQVLFRQVAHTREALGRTIEALASKADVTARGKDATAAGKGQLAQVTGRLRDTAAHVRRLLEGKTPDPGAARTNRTALIAAAGVLAGVLLVRRTRRTRRTRRAGRTRRQR